jgi:uncharacterized membrane protein
MSNNDKLKITIKPEDIGRFNVNQNLQIIFIYSLCLMFAFGINSLLEIFLKGKKYSILFYFLYIIFIVSAIILLSYKMKSTISL